VATVATKEETTATATSSTTTSTSTETETATTQNENENENALEVVFAIEGSRNTNEGTDKDNHHGCYQPRAVRTVSCQTPRLECESLSFSGSASAKLIQAFSGSIGHHITTALQQHVCPLLPTTVDPVLTAYLTALNDFLQRYLDKDDPGGHENRNANENENEN